MRALAALLLILAAAAPMPPPDRAPGMTAPVSLLSPDSALRWVPFDLTPGNQIRFTMTLDGEPVTAILDTGLSYSVLSSAYAKAARLNVAQSGDATVIGGVIPIGWAATRRLSMGGLTRTGGEMAVAEVPSVASGGDKPIDLLIGPDLLAGYALDIDYDARRFRLLPSGRLPFRGETAPLWLSPTHNIYLSQAALNGVQLRPVVIDTGDGSMLTLAQKAWRAAEPHPPPTTTATAYGLGGTIVTDLAIVPQVDVGDLTARRIEVRIEAPAGFSDQVSALGRIGSGFLERYRVLLDPGAGRIVFAPGKTVDTSPVRSTSGLLLAFEKDRLRVMHVMRGGPAEAAGWKQGDTICSVDGTAIPPDYPGSALGGWSIGVQGRIVALGMCDGSVRHLTLRNFY